MGKFETALKAAIEGKTEVNDIEFMQEEAKLAYQSEILALKRRRSAVEQDIKAIEKNVHVVSPTEWIPNLVAKKKQQAMIEVEEKILAQIGLDWFNMPF